MTQLGFYFDQTRCTGCFTCLVACKDWHDIHVDTVQRMRVREIEKGRFPDLFVAFLALACCHCENPPCVAACPADAISKREGDGIVVVNPDVCTGIDTCKGACRKACPWDAPQFGPEENARMDKCDLCLDRLTAGQQTICVEACPMYALDVGPIEELEAKYETEPVAEGFRPGNRFRPSVRFRSKHSPLLDPAADSG
jgi:anaerobic dimethyl sulfoxide reductase subunit B (iron-sulfur subunit)